MENLFGTADEKIFVTKALDRDIYEILWHMADDGVISKLRKQVCDMRKE